MSGHIARKGFRYQDLYLLLRVLRSGSGSLESAWRSGANNVLEVLDANPARFGIEAADSQADSGQVTDWDVLVLDGERFEFAEVKSGEVGKQDRITFWNRVRRELQNRLSDAIPLVPVLVIDPEKIGNIGIWSELAEKAATFTSTPPSEEPRGNVVSSTKLLNEALWIICSPDDTSDGSDPSVDPATALAALSQFELHSHKGDELEEQVEQFLDLLFPGGLPDTQCNLLIGWLGRRAVEQIAERRLFTIRELLQEIGILRDAISMEAGSLKRWRDLWNEVPSGVRVRTRLSLGKHGGTLPPDLVQPIAQSIWDRADIRSQVVTGPGGAGKSVFLANVAKAAALQGHEVLHCGADDITLEEIEDLSKAVRFTAALKATREPGSTLVLCIDALDEAEGALRKRLAQLLVRISDLPNVRTLVSIRDTVWRSDGEVRRDLGPWEVVPLSLWPESIITELLSTTPYREVLPPAVIELLRTPILLDLFWRTFVEAEIPDAPRASKLNTRHGLLAAFWVERLVGSPRYASTPDLVPLIGDVVSRAAASVGGFSDSDLNAASVTALLSEGVLVREGSLQPRLLFRHPLLRDFAFAQWCLGASDPNEVARRWNAMTGGLQRHGALRAIFEALTDSDARSEYPHLNLGSVVQAIVAAGPHLASQVADVLGSQTPNPALDPSNWPPTVQGALPGDFARDLLIAARLQGNGTWACLIERWTNDLSWMNDDYPAELLTFGKSLAGLASTKVGDIPLGEQARCVARKLRELSEDPRYESAFQHSDRWLKMHSLIVVIPVVPDLETFAWVEREMNQSSWRTRAFVLGELIHLTKVDPFRTANIYRQAVGIRNENGGPRIDFAGWFGTMDHQAIEWSLGGERGRQGLIEESPEAFLPAAVELAEALWIARDNRPSELVSRIGEALQEAGLCASEEEERSFECLRQERIRELIDDSPEWRLNQSYPSDSPYERCLRAIRMGTEDWLSRSPSSLSTACEILRASRMASVHMILFEILHDKRSAPGGHDHFRESVIDSRLYHISGFDYWIEQGLMAIWSELTGEECGRVFEILNELLESEPNKRRAMCFLARIPLSDIPDHIRTFRPNDGDPNFRPRVLRNIRGIFEESDWVPMSEEEEDVEIGEWPDEFDTSLLQEFCKSSRLLSRENVAGDDRAAARTTLVRIATVFVPQWTARIELLEDSSRFWVWEGLRRMLASFERKRSDDNSNVEEPDPELVLGISELALRRMAAIPEEIEGKLPEGDMWSGYQELPWEKALQLADESLTWPPAHANESQQLRFVNIVRSSYETCNPILQIICSIQIRPWHWLQSEERRNMHAELLEHIASGTVLTWTLASITRHPDAECARIFRSILNREGISDSGNLCDKLGRFIGVGGMRIRQDGCRSSVADLARECVMSPDAFPLLREGSDRVKFLKSIAFGMKEQAKETSEHTELAGDYGIWMIQIWRNLRMLHQGGRESENVVLFATHWLEKSDSGIGREVRRAWWINLLPLLELVAREGGRPDCFNLLFPFRSGDYNDVAEPEEVLGIIQLFVDRILVDGVGDLDEADREGGDYRSWRECSKYASEAIDSLSVDGCLRTEAQQEQAYRILTALAGEPIRCTRAMEVRHRLQNQ